MDKSKINIPIKSKLIIKNKSPQNKNDCLSKIINKKQNMSSQQIIIKQLGFYKKKISPQKINIVEGKNIKNSKIKENKVKKRQNKFVNKQVKEKCPLILNSNLNSYRIIHSKDNKNNIKDELPKKIINALKILSKIHQLLLIQ